MPTTVGASIFGAAIGPPHGRCIVTRRTDGQTGKAMGHAYVVVDSPYGDARAFEPARPASNSDVVQLLFIVSLMIAVGLI